MAQKVAKWTQTQAAPELTDPPVETPEPLPSELHGAEPEAPSSEPEAAQTPTQIVARIESLPERLDPRTGERTRSQYGKYPFRDLEVGQAFEVVRAGNYNPTYAAMRIYTAQRGKDLNKKFVIYAEQFPNLIVKRIA